MAMSALLACGPNAAISHGSAAVLWEVPATGGSSSEIEVSVSAKRRTDRAGVRVHYVNTLGPDEITILHGLAITTPARTVLDLATRSSSKELERALAHAFRSELITRAQLKTLLTRHPRRRGTGILRTLLESRDGPRLTRSEAESILLEWIRKAQLQLPEMNVKVSGFEVDFYWRKQRFVVELDGYAYHRSAEVFEKDRRRDAVLAAAGIRVMRVTWTQLTKEPEALLVRIAQALARS